MLRKVIKYSVIVLLSLTFLILEMILSLTFLILKMILSTPRKMLYTLFFVSLLVLIEPIIYACKISIRFIVRPLLRPLFLATPSSFYMIFFSVLIGKDPREWLHSYHSERRRQFEFLRFAVLRVKYFRQVGSASFIALALLIMAIGALLTVMFWDWLHGTAPNSPASTTLRNMGILVGGVLALIFAVWRGLELEKQSLTSHRVADISERNLRNERYQRGAEMLGSDDPSIRLAGIFALQRLAEEFPEEYHIQIMRLFCAFVRNPAGHSAGSQDKHPEDNRVNLSPREDIQAILDAFRDRNTERILLEGSSEGFKFDLSSANLPGVILDQSYLESVDFTDTNLTGASLNGCYLRSVNFSNAILLNASLEGTDLSYTSIQDADLTNANLSHSRFLATRMTSSNLSGADISYSDLTHAKMESVMIWGANLNEANLSYTLFTSSIFLEGPDAETKGLTQLQLDQAVCEEHAPPSFFDLVDAETGKPLVWNGPSEIRRLFNLFNPSRPNTAPTRVQAIAEEIRRHRGE